MCPSAGGSRGHPPGVPAAAATVLLLSGVYFLGVYSRWNCLLVFCFPPAWLCSLPGGTAPSEGASRSAARWRQRVTGCTSGSRETPGSCSRWLCTTA